MSSGKIDKKRRDQDCDDTFESERKKKEEEEEVKASGDEQIPIGRTKIEEIPNQTR